ncbi:hypothetical protein D1007_04088 [Hordeum vulgare]|nr:hypothetical protein D1007_04088 [Hordeum vulgare]
MQPLVSDCSAFLPVLLIRIRGSPADSSPDHPVSFGGHADAFAKAPQAGSAAAYYGAASAPVAPVKPKQEVDAAAVVAVPAGEAELRRHGRRPPGRPPAGRPTEPGPHPRRAEAAGEAQRAVHRAVQDRPGAQEDGQGVGAGDAIKYVKTLQEQAGEHFSLSVKDIVRKLHQAFKSSP